jgi:hemoglobin
MARPSLYEFAGGEQAMLALAAAHHQRCIDDPYLNHPFSHMHNPRHVEALADYLGEVFGGPARYSAAGAGHSGMLGVHAGEGVDDEFGGRFVACFVQALDDAGLPRDAEFRAAMRRYMEWAVGEVVSYGPPGSEVKPSLPTPRWTWQGLASATRQI